MSAPTRLLSALGPRLARPSGVFNRSQWRSIERQWQRHYARQPLPFHHLARQRPALPRHSRISLSRRLNSTSASASAAAAAPSTRLRNFLYGSGLVLVLAFGFLYVTDTRAGLHQWLVVPALRLIHADPEEAHHAAIRYIRGLYAFGLHPRERDRADEALADLTIEVFGHMLDNPVGTSAGMDKDSRIPSALFALGPAIVEVGGVTPRPQQGNPKPRVFRLPSQNALINRYGLNSEGAEYVAMQLRERVRQFAYANGLGLEPESERLVLDGAAGVPPGSLQAGRLLAVNIGKNKDTPDADIAAVARDYVDCVRHLGRYADILVVNVSSPNTPGLRDLQAAAPLTAILKEVVREAKTCDRASKPAVMVKVSPDEDSDAQVDGICAAVWESGVDGVVVGNTTKKRPDPLPRGYLLPADEAKVVGEVGGYSGPQLFGRTVELVKKYRSRLDLPPEGLSSAKETPPPPPPSNPDSPEASTSRDAQHLKPLAASGEGQQPLLQVPERHHNSSPSSTTSSSSPSPATAEPKVIFATGGIATGEQCLQVLNAGASVCQVYTAMMYGGVGTVTRMKGEMREVLRRRGGER